MSDRRRDPFLDALKGIAIIMVVLGHAIYDFYPDTYSGNLLYKICYSFHMALFFEISGFLCGGRAAHDLKWLKKRGERLLIPWLIWTAVICVIQGEGMHTLIKNYLSEPSYWFLICLFLCESCLALLCSIKRHQLFALAGLYLLSCVLGVGLQIRIMKDIVVFLPFFLLGFLYQRNQSFIGIRVKRFIMLGSLIFYPVSMTVFTAGVDEAEQMAHRIADRLGIVRGVGILKISIWANSRFAIAAFGTICCITIMAFVMKRGGVRWQRLCAGFVQIGRHTMPIYLMSCCFRYFRFHVINNAVSICLSMILDLLIPYFVSAIVLNNRAPALKRILFGS